MDALAGDGQTCRFRDGTRIGSPFLLDTCHHPSTVTLGGDGAARLGGRAQQGDRPSILTLSSPSPGPSAPGLPITARSPCRGSSSPPQGGFPPAPQGQLPYLHMRKPGLRRGRDGVSHVTLRMLTTTLWCVRGDGARFTDGETEDRGAGPPSKPQQAEPGTRLKHRKGGQGAGLSLTRKVPHGTELGQGALPRPSGDLTTPHLKSAHHAGTAGTGSLTWSLPLAPEEGLPPWQREAALL